MLKCVNKSPVGVLLPDGRSEWTFNLVCGISNVATVLVSASVSWRLPNRAKRKTRLHDKNTVCFNLRIGECHRHRICLIIMFTGSNFVVRRAL